MKFRILTQLCGALLLIVTAAVAQAPAPDQKTERPPFPTRDPHAVGYVTAKELPDGEVPPANVDGNFIIGPTHRARLNCPRRTARFGDA